MDIYTLCAVAFVVAWVLSVVVCLIRRFTYEDEKEGHKHEQTKRQS